MIKLYIHNFEETDVIVNLITKANTKGIDDSKKKTQEFKKAVDDAKKSMPDFKNIFSAVGITASLAGISKSIKKAVTDAANYEESINLFHMALGEFYEDGRKWSREIADALYLDDSEILQYAGSFYNLTKGLGASKDAAYLMSKNLTQLTYDMSSYLNIDVSAANTKLMSAMSGQTKAVTSVGIAVQQASLQELAYNLGIEKSVRNMTQAEKTYLRYIQIMRSTKQMQGDLGRTIITPTNAFRMLSTQVTLLGRAIGQVLTPIIYKLMPLLIALTRVLTEAAGKLASFFGYKMAEIDYTGVEGLTDSIEDLGKEVDKTAAKARRMLAPFDQLNVVETSSGGSGGVGGSILDELEKQLTGYDMLADLNEKMAGSISDWEGKLKTLGTTIMWVAGIVAGYKIISFLGSVSDGITGIATSVGTKLAGGFNVAAGDIVIGATSLVAKVSTVIGGLALAVSGVFKTIQGVTDTSLSDLESSWALRFGAVGTVVGSAMTFGTLFGPAGAVGGAILGLAGFFTTVGIAWDNMVQDMAIAQLNSDLGTLKLSTQQWLDTLLGGNSTLITVVEKIDEFNKSIETNTTNFNTAITNAQNDILLYASGVGQYATITQDMLTTITNDMESMATSSGEGIKAYVDKNLEIMQEQYEHADEEEKKLLRIQMEDLAQHGKNAEAEVTKNKNAIISIYAKANKEHRKLTDEEYKKVQEHLTSMSSAYNTFTSGNVTELSKFFDESGKLRDGYSYETIQNFIKAKTQYIDKVKEYADKEYNESKIYYDKQLQLGKINQEQYDKLMGTAEKTRADHIKTSQQQVDEYSKKMGENLINEWNKIEGQTGEVFDRMRTEIETSLNDLNIPASEIQKPLDTAFSEMIKNVDKQKGLFNNEANSLGTSFIKEFASSIANKKINLNVDTTYSSNNKMATIKTGKSSIFAKANGGFVDSGDFFLANEAGPEYITSIGNKSAVVNQAQMVAALSNAIVAATNGRVNSNKAQNIVVNLGNKKLYEGQGEYQSRENDRYGTTTVNL